MEGLKNATGMHTVLDQTKPEKPINEKQIQSTKDE